MRRSIVARRAFTLIELLVVVAIIALLISILLPSLARAREQARVVKCLANLKSIMLAASTYSGENREDFAWSLRRPADGNPFYTWGVWSELVWGGGIPSKTNAEFTAARANFNIPGYQASAFDVYRVPPRLRPMNRYLAADVTWDCEPNPTPTLPRAIPSEIPDFVRCPSDKAPYVPLVGNANPLQDVDTGFPTWEYWGNSYPINWYWPYYYEKAPPGNQPPYNGDFLAIMGVHPTVVAPSVGQIMMKNKDGRFASEFLMFYDNDMNYQLEAARPPTYTGSPWGASQPKRNMGWHGQFSRHSAGFLDGRAQNRTFDTRCVFGDGWTIWPNKPWQGTTWAAYNDKAPLP